MARRFGRRKRPNVQWMPTYGTQAGDPEAPRAGGIFSNFELTGDGAIRWDVTTLTFDDTKSQDIAGDDLTLQDMVGGNAWRLRRIVGKLFAHWQFFNEALAKQPPIIDYAAGFIVGKTDDEGTPTADFDEVNPLVQEGADDPWIWRRRWFLGTTPPYTGEAFNQPSTITFPDEYGIGTKYPSSTALYGSVADGPHIDQKTARVIDRQERLLFVQAARVWGDHVLYGAPGEMRSYLDYRLLGSILRTPHGNRRNASR